MIKSQLTFLSLSAFRSYAKTTLELPESSCIVLYGDNGAGKTNLLEAISFLSAGRGLRGVKIPDIANLQESGTPWAVSARLMSDGLECRIGTGQDPQIGSSCPKRLVRVDGQNVPQSKLSEILSVIWLTPQMDRLFIEASGARRRFLDRMIAGFDPSHIGRLSRYDNALSQRSKLLKEDNASPSWLDGLESDMAETGAAISAARLDFTERLQVAAGKETLAPFPQCKLILSGWMEEKLPTEKAVRVEQNFIALLKQTRERDAITGGAQFGPHKSDFSACHVEKNMTAEQCSTGEQKALLIGIILAHAHLITAERGQPPIILLDEVAAHLDEDRRAALFTLLEKTGSQVWLTGTERTLFSALSGSATFLKVENSTIAKVI